MATRFYLPSSGTAAFTPAYDAAWLVTAAAVRAPAPTVKGATALASPGGIQHGSTTASSNTLCRQFVSVDTVPSARTIGGTVSAVLAMGEGSSTHDAMLQLVIRVIAPNGTVRGTLYPGQVLTLVTTAGAQNQECAVTSTGNTRIWNAIALTPVAAQAGDHIVIEQGARFVTTLTNAAVYPWYGDTSATADHALTAGITTALIPWVELSEDVFAAAGIPAGAATGTVAWAGSSTGNTAKSGAATGTVAWAGAGTGTAVEPAEGTATGTMAWAGTAAGSALAPPPAGTATATVAWAGTGVGAAPAAVIVGVCSVLVACTGVVDYDPPLVEPGDLVADVDYDPETVAPPSRLHRVDDYVVHVTREAE